MRWPGRSGWPGRLARPAWLRLRGGLLSGSLLLAGFSAVLLSGLAVVGLRTVAGPGAQPDHVTMREVTGEVSVPDAGDGAATSARAHHESRPVRLTVPPTTDNVTTSRTNGPARRPAGSPVARTAQRPVPKPSSAPSAAPTPSPKPSSTPSSSRGHGHAHGHGHNR